ncbi:unnamed protein product [Durusdinium trenchii]|uniref:C3H1-type domain-containing protein n=1 Tax=Durusdinium trenchii TaxID=1381693 RepID=A0ABP0H6D9_9DINO
MPKKEVNDETVDEVKSTLQMSELPLPHEECTAHKADGSVPEGLVISRTFLEVREAPLSDSPSAKSAPEPTSTPLDRKLEKRMAKDLHLYTRREFIQYYVGRYVRRGWRLTEALWRAAQEWDQAKKVCSYCGTWKKFNGELHTFPSLLAALQGSWLRATTLWPDLRPAKLPASERWKRRAWESVPGQCIHHGPGCTHWVHGCCSRHGCAFDHEVDFIWSWQQVQLGPFFYWGPVRVNLSTRQVF